ncbi:MAG: HAD family hydrolase [Chloroflexota bacterium]|nr:HAD family hydrolase [Chloroflexota bacterium]
MIFDADDTLWENNIYFERAIHRFIEFLDHSHLSPIDVRAVLNEIEHANVADHGFGALSFTRGLRTCFERLTERELSQSDMTTVEALGLAILDQELELIAGVEETLALLGQRHQLLMLTKGDAEEQRLKIERSGLADYFTHTIVVPDKRTATYVTVIEECALEPSLTWMIGNSPKSDINPALAAGLNAAFIPHQHTWSLEHADIEHSSGQLLILERITDLPSHFLTDPISENSIN